MSLLAEKNHIWIICIAVLLLFGSHLGVLPVNIMEARNFITAREMVLDGNWLLTTMNGVPRYEKPPLPTWLTAFSGMAFGLKAVWALRIPAVLMSMLLMVGIYKFCAKALQLTKQQSLINTLIVATSFFILFSGRNGQWDIFTHAFMMIGIHFFFQLWEKDDKKYWHAIVAGVFIGLSFMSKGPVSLFALFLPFIIAYGIVFKYKKAKKTLIPLLVLIVIVVILSGWWPYYIYVFDGDDAQRIANKETAAWANKNVRPFYYYWSFFTQSGIWTIPAFIGLLYPYMKSRVSNLKLYRFTLLWTMIAVVLLSVIPEKKSRYLLPVLIPLGMNTGFYIDYLINRFKTLDKKESIPVFFNFGLIAIVGIAVPFAVIFMFKDLLQTQLIWVILTSIATFRIGILMIKTILKRNFTKVFWLTILFVMAVTTFGFPLSAAVKTNTAYRELNELNVISEKENLKMYDLINSAPELVWDYGSPIPTLYVDENTVKYPAESRFGLLVQPTSHDILKQHFSHYNISKRGTFDHNLMNASEKGHKKRLSRDFYILTKK